MTNANTPEARANEEALERASVDAWNAAIEAAAKVAKETCDDVAKGWRESESIDGVVACFQCERFTPIAIRTLKRPTDSEDTP